jgi:RNA polymerase primary sigma factor
LVSEANIAGARPLSQFLRLAVMAGVESAVQIHIERGDNLNARDASGMTPLMLSAARNKPAICKLLLEAGADHALLDPSGKTAHEIAIAAGSEATAAILEAGCSPIHSFPASTISTGPELDPAVEPTPLSGPISIGPVPAESEEAAEPQEPEIQANPSASEPALSTSIVVNGIDDEEFDLSGWEAEEPPARPEADLMVLDLASAVQTEITAHEPIDSSAGWDDIDAYLPEVALPLARADDVEGRAQLRRLLLRAIREGSVPSLDVQAQSSNEDRSVNPEAEAYLAMVINDLGAELDERLEYSDADENFEVFIDPEETPDEETILDDALVAIDRAASPRHEPLRIYQREFQRLQLLTAEKEIQLAKDMEAALDKALDALTGWPDGIARTLAAGAEAVAGFRQLSSIWAGVPEPDPEPASAESQEAGNPTAEKPESTVDEENQQEEESTVNAGKANFAHLLQQLDALVGANAAPGASPREIREALAALRLNRRFLLELIDAAQPCPGFRHAMADFRKARDCMAAANLKLSFFLAKKYLNSGELLDDLAQEGNIGLLKAVDRYDWRRGFRFSTYATWWIRQQIGRYIADKVRVIRVPVHIHEKLKRAERMAQDFETAAGREPTLDELAERVGMPRHKLAALLSIAPEPSSIDDTTIDSMIASDARDDYTSPDPADVVDGIQLNHAVNRFISSLSTRDRKEEHILRMRFGIGINEALTLDEIGTRFEVTRERIRQIEAKALKKLRHPKQAQPFARMVLGLHPEEPPLAPIAHEHEDDDEPEATEAAPLDQVLAQATELGIQVEDGRETPSGLIWVSLVDPSDNPHRRLARKLIEFGFEHSPGKGYWK